MANRERTLFIPFTLLFGFASQSMAIKIGTRDAILAWVALLMIAEPGSAASQGLELSGRAQAQRPLDQHVAYVEIPRAPLLEALFLVGKATGQCIGEALGHRASAVAEIAPARDKDMTLRAVLVGLIQSTKGLQVRERDGCAIVSATGEAFPYLRTKIALFGLQRGPLDLASSHLWQALLLTEAPPPPAGKPWGIAGDVAISPDSPKVGPMETRGQSVEKILSKVAREAGNTMWIAVPRNQHQSYEPWRFIRYTQPTQQVRAQLHWIIESLPD